MDASEQRIERIKNILGLEKDKDLAELCKTPHPRVSSWRHKGFHKTTEIIIDALLDQYEKDIKKRKKK